MTVPPNWLAGFLHPDLIILPKLVINLNTEGILDILVAKSTISAQICSIHFLVMLACD
jgi:hypothetical protein